jgi:hypothetical protein
MKDVVVEIYGMDGVPSVKQAEIIMNAIKAALGEDTSIAVMAMEGELEWEE